MVTAPRVLVVSDTHLSSRAPEAEANWSQVTRYANRSGVELVVHVCDLTLVGVNASEELLHARRLLDELPVRWVAVPGNHDIGDNPGVSAGPDVSDDRLRVWEETIGPDRWVVDVGPWALVGVNAQLFGADLPSATAQWVWLEAQLGRLRADHPVLFVCHKP